MAMTPDKDSTAADDAVAPLARHFLWVDTRRGVQKLILGLMALCAVLFALDFVWHRHVKVPGEELYGFHAIAGFLSFTVIVLGARLLRVFIRRDEDFYAPYGVDAEEYPDAGTCQVTHDQRTEATLSTLKEELMGRRNTEGVAVSERTSAGNKSS